MAKRKESDTPAEPARRSMRTKVGAETSAVQAPAAKPASKAKVSSKPADKEPEKKAEMEPQPVAEPEKTGGVVAVGSVVPDITLKNENDEDVSLASIYEKSGVAIFSYPKANTPGCTTQACGYRDLYTEISATGYQVFGLSADPPKAQLSWKTSKGFQYSLLSDPKKDLLKQLGATEATKRCHWIIEKGGKLLEAKIGVKPADDPKNVLAFIKAL